jgi:peptide/nickel transport system substrate-binding protein
VEFRIIPDPGARLAGLQAGEIDVAYDLSSSMLAAAPNRLTTPLSEVSVLRINTNARFLNDVRVRQALNYAVNKQTIIDNVRGGFAAMPNGQDVPPGTHGFNSSIKDYPYDPERAKALLREAGYDGTKFTFMCAAVQYGPEGADECQSVVADFSAVGVNVDLQLIPYEVWLNQGLLAPANGTPPPDLFTIQMGSETYDATVVINNYIACGPERGLYCDPEVKRIAEQASATTNPDEQARLYEQIMQIAHDQAAFVWMSIPAFGVGVRPDVAGQLYSNDATVFWQEWRPSVSS